MRATLSVAFLFFLGKTGVKQTFVQTRSEVINHTKTIQESKTGVGSVLRSQYQTAQLQRTVPPLYPLLQAKFSRHCGGLSPLRKQTKRKVLKSAPNRRYFQRWIAVMKVSAAEINAPHTRRKQQNTHPFPTEKGILRFHLANGVNRH